MPIQRRHDSRGHLDVLYEQGDLVLKRSFSRAGVFRGMHLQSPPHQQTKLIRVAWAAFWTSSPTHQNSLLVCFGAKLYPQMDGSKLMLICSRLLRY